MKALLLLVVLIAGIGWLYSNGKPPAPTMAAAQVAALPTIDKSEAMQADRLALLKRLVNEGVFTKFEIPGTLVRAFVGPRFYTLSIDDKQRFASVVYAYSYDGSNPTDLVRLFDGMSGKEVGKYPSANGKLVMF